MTDFIDPFLDWAITEDGDIEVRFTNDEGATYEVIFTNALTLSLLEDVHESAALALEIYETDGFAACCEYADKLAAVTEITDDDISLMLTDLDFDSDN